MIKIEINPKDALDGLKNMSNSINRNIESSLDTMANQTRGKMASEAPVASGDLSKSATVQSKPFWRCIFASLLYGSALERRDNMPQKTPPIEKLRKWAEIKGFADPERAAFALAKTIALKGYKANKFVERTFLWVQSKINSWTNDLGTKIVASYSR